MTRQTRAKVKITGVNTATVLLGYHRDGDHFRVDIDDTSVTVSVEPDAATDNLLSINCTKKSLCANHKLAI